MGKVDYLAAVKAAARAAETAILDAAGIEEGDEVPGDLANALVALELQISESADHINAILAGASQ